MFVKDIFVVTSSVGVKWGVAVIRTLLCVSSVLISVALFQLENCGANFSEICYQLYLQKALKNPRGSFSPQVVWIFKFSAFLFKLFARARVCRWCSSFSQNNDHET